ncbi:cupin domain-containing protein [Sesbania bispinosa]|nr:cupin domain-containing protein [Sesbania bispinosa]
MAGERGREGKKELEHVRRGEARTVTGDIAQEAVAALEEAVAASTPFFLLSLSFFCFDFYSFLSLFFLIGSDGTPRRWGVAHCEQKTTVVRLGAESG